MLDVEEADLLDGTPILDVKPYVPAADAFPEARAGWLERGAEEPWRVEATPAFDAAAAFVREAGGPDLARTARLQLSRAPFDASRKRVARTGEGAGTLSLRMFRVDFTADDARRVVTLVGLRSGYAPAELAAADDPYFDKDLHRAFAAREFMV